MTLVSVSFFEWIFYDPDIYSAYFFYRMTAAAHLYCDSCRCFGFHWPIYCIGMHQANIMKQNSHQTIPNLCAHKDGLLKWEFYYNNMYLLSWKLNTNLAIAGCVLTQQSPLKCILTLMTGVKIHWPESCMTTCQRWAS